jgi:hypothetical protein
MHNRKLQGCFCFIGDLLGWILAVTSFLYLLFSLVVYAFPALQEWQGLAFAPIRRLAMVTPPFADMAMLTHSARCSGSLVDLFEGAVNCDPYGRLFTYPPLALWMFRFLGLSSASLGWLGLLLGVVAALLTSEFFFTLIPSALVAGILLSVAYLSLPFQLVLERGNNDLIVFLLLALLSFAIAREQRGSAVAAAGLGFLAVATKILPLFGIVATHGLQPWAGSTMGPSARSLRWAVLGASAGLALVLPWIGLILKNSPRPSGALLSHGLLAGLSSSDSFTSTPSYGWLAMKLMFLAAGAVGAGRQGMPQQLRNFLSRGAAGVDPKLVSVTLSLFTATWIGTYLLTRSYDYKFIFLLPAVGVSGALLCQGNSNPGRRGWTTLVLMPILCTWLIPYLSISFFLPMGEWLELANDNVLLPLAAGALAIGLLGCRPRRTSSPVKSP